MAKIFHVHVAHTQLKAKAGIVIKFCVIGMTGQGTPNLSPARVHQRLLQGVCAALAAPGFAIALGGLHEVDLVF